MKSRLEGRDARAADDSESRGTALSSMWVALALTLALALSPSDAGGEEGSDWRGHAERDIEAAYRAALQDHPGGVDTRNPQFTAVAEVARERAMDRARRADSYVRYVQAVTSFFGAFQDYHFTVHFEDDDELPSLRWAGLVAVLDGDQMQVVASHDSLSDFVGRELLKCDGLTAEELYEQRVKPYQARPDIEATKRRRSPLVFTYRPGSLEPPIEACSFSAASGEPIRLRLDWSFDGDEYRELVRRSLYGTRPEPGIRQYRPGRWWINASNFNPADDEEKASVEAMLEAAERFAPRMREAEAVVIDIRGNGGGSSSYGTQIVDAIWGEPYRRSREPADESFVEWRVSEDNVAYMDELVALVHDRKFPADVVDHFTSVRSGMKEALAAGRTLYREATEAGESGRTADAKAENLVAGSVFFLTNIGCGSSCLDFADLVLSLENVTQVGQVTTADTQYMEVRRQPAPSGFARFVIPVKVYRDRLRAPLEAYRPEIFYDGFDWSDEAIVGWADAVIDDALSD